MNSIGEGINEEIGEKIKQEKEKIGNHEREISNSQEKIRRLNVENYKHLDGKYFKIKHGAVKILGQDEYGDLRIIQFLNEVDVGMRTAYFSKETATRWHITDYVKELKEEITKEDFMEIMRVGFRDTVSSFDKGELNLDYLEGG